MKKEEIKKFIINYLEKKGKLPDDIDFDNFDYINNGYVDSMGIIKFVAAIEEKYNIEITEEDILSQEFRKINGLINLILKRK